VFVKLVSGLTVGHFNAIRVPKCAKCGKTYGMIENKEELQIARQ
jgi:ribosomal protein L34E